MQTKQIFKRYSLELVEEENETYNGINLKDIQVKSSDMVYLINNVFNLSKKPEECLILLCLNTKNKINAIFEVCHGGTNAVNIPVTDVLKRALLVNSNKIIVCHNHPSGDCTPSSPDRDFTKHLSDACEILGITLLDHLIIGENCFYSMLLKGGARL